MSDKASAPDPKKGIAIYHVVYKNEGFEKSARILHEMVRDAARQHPGVPRHLYLDIEGHRNRAGGFDHDMVELQTHFIVGWLGQYLTTFPTLGGRSVGVVTNPSQSDDVPDEMIIRPAPDKEEPS